MIINYLRTACRSLLQQKTSSLINLCGLAIGLAACTLIVLFVQHEFSYDQAYRNADRIYRIEATANIPGQQSNESPTFFGTAYNLLPLKFEEIESIARLQRRGGTVINQDSFIPETFSTVDPEFLRIFDFPMLEGQRESALAEPNSIILTREMAEKHLGTPPWLGQTLKINETRERNMKVTGVMETLPGNTHFDIDFLVPVNRSIYEAIGSVGSNDLERWNGLPFYVYVMLKADRSLSGLASGLNAWVDENFPSQIQALVGISGSELFTPRVIPLRDIHMYSPVQFDMRAPGNLNSIIGFASIALLMLAVACVNFVNLSLATSTLRAREVALRKVLGANRRQLFVQFEIESLLATLLALLLAVALVAVLLPYFADFTQRELTLDGLTDWKVLTTLATLALLVGVLAGLHPALVLSGFRPARILNFGKTITGGGRLRSLLVLFQFTISAGLIISTVLVYVQTEYARSIDMGYDNERILSIRGLVPDRLGEQVPELVRDEIARLPGVTETSLASFTPGDGRNVGLSLKRPGQDERLIIFYRSVYPQFFAQFDVSPLAGRLLSDRHSGDRTILITDPDSTEPQNLNVVINESAAKSLGFTSPEAAIGGIYYRGQANQIVSTIVGVVPDIHFGSPRAELDGEIYMYLPDQVTDLLVSYGDGQLVELRALIDARLKTLLPKDQTRIQHLRDNIADQYQEEAIQSTLLALFSALGVLIACMGLYGLSSFTIARRTREIGIRKVMGASASQIVALLLRQFSRPVIIANVIAWPICWYLISRWLQAFNHQIALFPWFLGVTAIAVLTTILLAWMTIASHAIRVARANPVHALRVQ
jgi:putative ABC transport system permease protein